MPIVLPTHLALAIGLLSVGGTIHALHVEVVIRNTMLHIEAFYDDDLPAQQAKVTLTRIGQQAQAMTVHGTTDDKGVWETPLPPTGDYTVIVDAGAGHKTTKTISITGLGPQANGLLGAGREELTAIPWAKVLVGFAAIGVFFLVLGIALRRRDRLSAIKAAPTP